MAKKSSKKKKIEKQLKKIPPAVLITVAIIMAICVIIYFVCEPVRGAVNRFIDNLTSPTVRVPKNEAKGDNELRMHFLDVGQGDSIFIEFPDETVMLIDSSTKNKQKREYIIKYIKDLGYTTINYLMATHSDEDHVGNMVEVIEAFEIEIAYVPDVKAEIIGTDTYTNFITALKNEEGCEIKNIKVYDTITSIDQDTTFYFSCLWPTQSFYDEINDKSSLTSKDRNDVSPIMLLEYQDKRAVFTGDANDTVERQVVNSFNNGVYNSSFDHGIDLRDVDVLKAGHHGSSGSSCTEFLELLSPEYTVISCGAGNTYGHPHNETLDRLEEVGSVVYRTDQNGRIMITIVPDTEKELVIVLEKGKTANLTSVKTEICLLKREIYILSNITC